jgi:hypothetical protein
MNSKWVNENEWESIIAILFFQHLTEGSVGEEPVASGRLKLQTKE